MADPVATPASIKARIAALNLEEIHQPAPGAPPPYVFEQVAAKKSRPPPPPPPLQRPSGEPRRQTTNNPPLQSNAPASARKLGNQPIRPDPELPSQQPALPPRLPPRANTQPLPPSLPPRKASETSIKRRESVESISTIASGLSSLSVTSTKTSLSGASNNVGEGQSYRIKAPPYDPSKLPPLPPKREKGQPKPARVALKSAHSAPSVISKKGPTTIQPPPALPSRPPLPARQTSAKQDPPKPEPVKRSALSFGMNKPIENSPPSLPSRPQDTPPEPPTSTPGSPPPIPLSTRPNLAALQASKPKPSAATATAAAAAAAAASSCLICRDFSAPDTHAAQFPLSSLPPSTPNPTTYLAHQLTAPFPSATDKARALFTWLHHNIAYDTTAFFAHAVQPSTPASTLRSGLAVCEGYAALFAALAAAAGLDAVVVSGHGKGYGHRPLPDTAAAVPGFRAGHAWNAVRIDGGEWKLVDCCWGAGTVQGPGLPYQRVFAPRWFDMANREFGATHFPADRSSFYAGGWGWSWEEYMREDRGDRVLVYGPATPEHGVAERSFVPAGRRVGVTGGGLAEGREAEVVRFAFAVVCPHWEHERHGKGKPYLMVLHVEGRDGRAPDYIPFHTDGRAWWLDVQRAELGVPGQKVSVFAVTSFGGQDGRGLGVEEFRRKKGRVGMGFGGVAMWELV